MDNLSYRGRSEKYENSNMKNNYDGINFSASPHNYKPNANKKYKPKLYQRLNWKLIGVVLVIWMALVNYYERSVVKRAMNVCQWTKWEKWVCIDENCLGWTLLTIE